MVATAPAVTAKVGCGCEAPASATAARIVTTAVSLPMTRIKMRGCASGNSIGSSRQNVAMTRRMRKKLQQRLSSAALCGDARQVARALRSGADPNLADRDHGTPLYLASVHGSADAVRVLVRAGADPNQESAGLGSDGLPLCAAACWGHTETVRELLAAGFR